MEEEMEEAVVEEGMEEVGEEEVVEWGGGERQAGREGEGNERRGGRGEGGPKDGRDAGRDEKITEGSPMRRCVAAARAHCNAALQRTLGIWTLLARNPLE
jgi:hypothetical protein